MRETLVNIVQISDPDIPIEERNSSPCEDMILPKEKKKEKAQARPSQGLPIRINLDMSDPFYVSFNINSHILRNCIINSGSPFHIMPLRVMQNQNFNISNECTNKLIMNFEEVKIHGVIKGGKVSFLGSPEKEIIVDIIVVQTHPSWGMILSKQLIEDLKIATNDERSSIYLHMGENSYALVPRETFFAPMIASSKDFDEELIEENVEPCERRIFKNELVETTPSTEMWIMYFDGAKSQAGFGARVGIVLISPFE